MTRMIIKASLLIGVIGGFLLYYIPLLNGYPPFYHLSIIADKFSSPLDQLKDVERKVKTQVKQALPKSDAKPVKVYRWQDKAGKWHFSDSPPPKGQAYEEQIIDPATNVIQSTPVIAKKTPPEENKQKETEKADKKEPPSSGPASAEGVKKLIQQANDIKAMMEQRQAQMDQMLNKQNDP